jgi:hypothetical protein
MGAIFIFVAAFTAAVAADSQAAAPDRQAPCPRATTLVALEEEYDAINEEAPRPAARANSAILAHPLSLSAAGASPIVIVRNPFLASSPKPIQ